MGRAAVITGLAAELDVLADALPLDQPSLRAFLACAGADGDRAAAHAQSYLALGLTNLVSFGVCGALDPSLRPGQIVLPERVLTKVGWAFEADPRWRAQLSELASQAGLEVAGGDLLGSDQAIFSSADKAALFQDKRGRVVDMESHGIARAADKAEASFVVLRVVADPADRTVPGLVEGLIGADGRPRTGLAALRLLAQPWQLPAMTRLRADLECALRSLRQAADVLGEALLRPA